MGNLPATAPIKKVAPPPATNQEPKPEAPKETAASSERDTSNWYEYRGHWYERMPGGDQWRGVVDDWLSI